MPAFDLRRFPLFPLLIWTWLGTLVPSYPLVMMGVWGAWLVMHGRGVRVGVAACAVGLGATAAWMHAATPLLPPQTELNCTVRVHSLVKTTDRHHRFEAQVTGGHAAAQGHVLRCWIPAACPAPSPGDLLGLQGSLARPQPALLPGAFDSQQYYRQQGWAGSLFADTAFVLQDASASTASLKRLQHTCTARLRAHLTTPEAQQLLPALVLGNRTALGHELRDQFAASGAMHVLAVSGMHLGLVFVLLKWCLRWMPVVKGRWVRCAVLLVGTWAFALLTGGAVSTVRAALLLSAVQLADTWHRPRQTLHILAGCAWLQLLVDPCVWQQAGFQLSYAAVAGIVLLEPVLKSKRWQTPRLLRPMCGLIRVAVAAQLATTPFAVLHFHQFPTWFLISSVVVVPAATLLLVGGLALIATSGTAVAEGIGWALDQLCAGVSWTVSATSSLPGAVYTLPAWSVLASGLWLAGLIAFYRWRQAPSPLGLFRLGMICMAWACVFDLRPAPLPTLAVVADREGWVVLAPRSGACLLHEAPLSDYTRSALTQWLGPLSETKNAPDSRRMDAGVVGLEWEDQQGSQQALLLVGACTPGNVPKETPCAVVQCVRLSSHQRRAWQRWCTSNDVAYWPAWKGRAWLSSATAAPG